MPRIAYFMHVPWNWARQRPHHAAEGLSSEFNVDVFLPANPAEGLPTAAMPSRLRLNPFRSWRAFYRTEAPALIPHYDLLWFCSPQWFSLAAPAIRPEQRVVYDCMDEFLAFPGIAAGRLGFTRFLLDEVSLVERADLLFCSSDTLAGRMRDRYRPSAEIRVIHNAAEIDDDPGDDIAPARTALKSIAYVGTIAAWMDFDLLLAGLDAFPATRVDLYGPAEVEIPAHPRLRHHGPLLHSALHRVMRAADMLVMPFKVDELVAGVNPVKLYEYIHAGRPCVSVRYPETERFLPFVHLYSGRDEYFEILRRLTSEELKPAASPAEARAFIAVNTWADRHATWNQSVRDLLGRPAAQRSELPHLSHLRRHLERAATHVEALEVEIHRRDARIELLARGQRAGGGGAAPP